MHIVDGAGFGAMVKKARQDRGLSGREAAKQMGVSPSRLLQVEKGSLPMGRTMIIMLGFYGITATVGYPPQPDPEPKVLS